ncbi:NADH-quinone oxidoreductase subunit M [Agilicoccus flavus]|uniref:NADH-quinone oxidoreductase subunit M n=1 Tax=Agilicoccus flavus TaxID=2775968 RepID=UPI001CF60766|nr:NADH-quinone oxidoreductase subunit M [Agilicoccus flavus]
MSPIVLMSTPMTSVSALAPASPVVTAAGTSASAFPWLTLIGAIPLLGALLLFALPGRAQVGRALALGFSLLAFVVSVVAATRFDPGSTAQFQLGERLEWIPQFGVSYSLGVDGMGIAMIVMSTIIVPVCVLAGWHDVPEGGRRRNVYFAWMLLLEAMIIGVFASTDVFLFYVFFEAMLVPVYFLIGSYGGPQRHAAATKFLLVSLAGGLVMLAAVIGVYVLGPGGPDGFLVERLTGLSFDPLVERLLFVGFFLAFAIKAPMWPVHTWLPQAASQATPATSTLLVGILDKVGTFGMIRFCLQMFPEASRWATPVVIVLALVSIVFGAAVAIGQDDMLRLIAYTSISHFGFIVLGIFAFTHVAGAGSVLYMVNHGFSTAAMFLMAGMLAQRRGSVRISDYGGWQRVTPVLAGCFLVTGLATLSLPGMGSFVSEFLVMLGTFQRYPWAAAVSSLGIILAAIYILLWYQRVMTGPKPEGLERVPDLTGREKWVMAPLIAAFLVLGFYPAPVLDVINPSVSSTLQHAGVTEPRPTNPAPAGAMNGSAK